MATLIGMSGDVKGKSYPLDEGDLTIGRAPDNTVSIQNATVSGHHCRISAEDGHYVLRDLGSTNGTRVNGRDIREQRLKPKDLVQAGSVEFLYQSDELIEDEEPEMPLTRTEVIVSSTPGTIPASFGNSSPFAARRKDGAKSWLVVIGIMAALALAGVAFLLYRLFLSPS